MTRYNDARWYNLSPQIKYMITYRKASDYKKNSIRGLYYRLRLKQLSERTGIQIPTKTKIGRGFYIGHFGTIIINPEVIIGDNVNIAPGVTIGRTNRGNNKGVPRIGNNVWIGTNSVLVGNITIGDDVLIAPNAFINTDVPSHCVVVGNHVTAFQNIIILNLCMIAQYVYKKRLDMIIPTSVAIVGFVIVMLAPGTRVRQGEEMSQSVLSTLVHTVLWCYKYLCSWINIQYLCMLILLIPVAIFVSSRIFINKTRLIHPLWILLVELLVICGMLCVPYKAMGNFGQDRLLNTIWMTFMLFSAFLWVYYLIWSNLLDSLKDIVFSKYGRLFLFVAGVVLFFYSNSNFMDYLELFLKGEAADYYTARF